MIRILIICIFGMEYQQCIRLCVWKVCGKELKVYIWNAKETGLKDGIGFTIYTANYIYLYITYFISGCVNGCIKNHIFDDGGYMKAESLKKKNRIYDWRSVVKRHRGYIVAALNRSEFYDFRQQALRECEKCQEQRNYRNPVELRRLSKELDNEFIISRIAVSVTNQCSLKCRDCNNLMPYCKEKYVIGIDEQIKDIKKILSYADAIINLEIIGGEPFVYKQLPKLLQYVLNEERIRFVEITTNGTVLPCTELTKLLSDPKLCVLVSDYGEVNSERAKKTYQYLKENHVCVRYLGNTRWIASGGIDRRKKSRLRITYEYFHCPARKDCRTLYKGKLYVCGRAPVLDELGLLANRSSYLDIRNMKNNKIIGRNLLKKFYMNRYAECCDYCDYSTDKVYWVKSGIQVK